MSLVTDDMVQAALDTYSENEWRTSVSAMRSAISAVAPLIAAAERERCARVADGTPYHGRYRTWPWWANPDGSQGNRENESDVVRHADAIAAAIRALSHKEDGR